MVQMLASENQIKTKKGQLSSAWERASLGEAAEEHATTSTSSPPMCHLGEAAAARRCIREESTMDPPR
jgi:hypothetical protein